MKTYTLLVPITLCAVGCGQLPPTTLLIDAIPTFDASSIVSSKNGIIAVDITKVPGTVCVPDPQGQCASDGFLTNPVLAPGSKVSVTASTNTTPQYHSLISNKYQVSASVPFVSASGSDEFYDEIKATVLATATVADNATDSGYPGLSAIRSALTSNGRVATTGYVYWISAANIIAVSRNRYSKVGSTANVAVTGVGVNGSTYNGSTDDQQKVWIGILAHKIELGNAESSGVGAAPPAATRFTTKNFGNINLDRLPPVVTSQFLHVEGGNFIK